MTHRRAASAVLVVCLVIAGMAIPAAAIDFPENSQESNGQSEAATVSMAVANNTSNGSVNVSVGQQLSTVISVTSDDVETEFEQTAFELEYEGGNESAKAESIAARAERLQERADAIRADYEDATEAYREGELTKDQYAQRLATLNARASNVLDSAETLRSSAQNISALELRAAGLSERELSGLAETLSSVTGAGPTAILHRFTGETEGDIELVTQDGLQIEVESEDGEISRELSRDRDDDQNITVSQTDALDTARGALATPDQGAWTLQKAGIHPDSGYYTFEFALTGTNQTTGEAEVHIDGSTGDVFRVEEEIEPVGDDEDERDGDEGDGEEGDDADAADDARDEDSDDSETGDDSEGEDGDDSDGDDREDGELALVIVNGSPAPGATITVQAIANGEPAANATITMNGRSVGTTSADGTLDVTLPESSEVELHATSGDADGELEFDLGEDEGEAYRNLDVSTSITNDTVTVTVTYDGKPVSGTTISANGDVVGTTDSSGTVTFTTPADDELELEIEKGEFEADLSYTLQGDSLTQTDDVGDSDDGESDDDDSDEQETEDEQESDDESDGGDSSDSGSDVDDSTDDSSDSGTDDDDDSSGSDSDGEETTEDDSSGDGS